MTNHTTALTGTQPMIVAVDVDNLLFDKLAQILKAGIKTVEINSHDRTLLAKAIATFPDLKIGAGNIINTHQLEESYHAGVHFATSPGLFAPIAHTAAIYSMNYIPGVATLSEAMHAVNMNCHQVRPCPADLRFCTILNKYLPDLQLYPADVDWEETEHFLHLPSVAAVSIVNPDERQLKSLSLSVSL